MLSLKFLFGLFLCLIFIRAGFIHDQLLNGVVLHMDRFDSQCHGKNVPCTASFQGVKSASTIVFIENITVVVKEGGLKKLKLTITLNRCRSRENLDTCEEYRKQGNIDFCTAIDPDNPLISRSPLFVPFVPPLKCPIHKVIFKSPPGVYHGYNISFDLAPFILFKLDGLYWRIAAEVVSEQNRLIYCFNIDGYLTNSRTKKN